MLLNYYQEKFFSAEENQKLEYLFKWQKESFNKSTGQAQYTRHSDLNTEIAIDHSTAFLIRVKGNSMIGAGIKSGDILMVDSARQAKDDSIVIAEINGALAVKKLRITEDRVLLISENPDYEPIEVRDHDRLEIWGVVAYVIKDM